MKLIVFVFVAVICVGSINAVDQTPPEIPSELEGYEGFSLVEVRKHSALLNTFASLTPNFVVQAIQNKRMYPASYSVFMRYCFEKRTETGSEILYYLRAYDHTNPKGKIYYGTFIAVIENDHRKFVEYKIDKSFPRPPKKNKITN